MNLWGITGQMMQGGVEARSLQIQNTKKTKHTPKYQAHRWFQPVLFFFQTEPHSPIRLAQTPLHQHVGSFPNVLF